MKKRSRFDTIFELTARGFSLINSSTGQIVEGNKRFCDLFGLNNDDLPVTTFMDITHPDDLQEDLDNMQKLLDGEFREFSLEKRYIHADGSIVWGNLTVAALWDVGDEPDFHIAIVEDITERKRAEEALHKAKNLLQEKVAERTQELEAKAQELQSVNKLLKEHERELCARNKELEDLNTALKIFIQKKDEAQIEMGENILSNINAAIEPSLAKLEQSSLGDSQHNCIAVIRRHLEVILDPFTRKLKTEHSHLSPTEIKVADLIKHGFSTKKIAGHLHISSDTVSFHRKNIRKKLGLTNSQDRLVAYLQKVEQW